MQQKHHKIVISCTLDANYRKQLFLLAHEFSAMSKHHTEQRLRLAMKGWQPST